MRNAASAISPRRKADAIAAEDEEQPAASATSIPSPVLLGGMVRQGFQLYRSNLGALVLCFLPFIALTAAFLIALGSLAIDPTAAPRARARDLLLIWLLGEMIRIVLMSLGVGAAIIVLSDRLAGRRGLVRAALRETMRSAQSTALAGVAAWFPYVFTVFMFGPPMAALMRGLFLGPPIVVTAIVLERRRIGAALSRARDLLALNWSRMLLYLITIAAGVGLFDFMVQYGLRLGGTEAGLADVVVDVVGLVAGTLLSLLFLPFIACVWLIAYFDLRARAEDFDEPAMKALRPPTPE